MSQRYLLSCSCGETTPVGVSQAGTTVTCRCGQTLSVPSIRGLKQLPIEASARSSVSPPKARPAEVNGVNTLGAYFVAGLLLLAIGLGTAGYNGYIYSQVDTKDYNQEFEAEDEKGIAALNVMQLYATWQTLEKSGIGEYQPPHHVLAREYSANAFRWMVGGIVVSVVALATCVYSVTGGLPVRRKT